MNTHIKKQKIIAVVGPTASGKSDLAMKIALDFGGEIVSCDSMQIYKGMDIGTAKPTIDDMSKVRHHMIDICDIDTPFCVADYVSLAKECVAEITQRNKLSVFCGGTGLYIDSLVAGTDFGSVENLPEYRKELEQRAKDEGNRALLSELFSLDPEYAQNLDAGNLKRIIRGLEICRSTGKTVTQHLKEANSKESDFDALYIGLYYENRDILYERINKRVDIMLENGLLNEARTLYEKGLETCATSGQAIGYKEFYPYFKGEDTLENCIEKLKLNSRHYAKRQLTWFKRNKNIMWLCCDADCDSMNKQKIHEIIESFLQNN